MELIRDYLTNDEIFKITNYVVTVENPFDRQITIDSLVIQMLSKDDSLFKDCPTCNHIYDVAMDNGFDTKQVKNYDILQRIISAQTEDTIVKKLQSFLEGLNAGLEKSYDEVKNFETNEFLDQVKKELEKNEGNQN